jgi:hypothetical protein
MRQSEEQMGNMDLVAGEMAISSVTVLANSLPLFMFRPSIA